MYLDIGRGCAGRLHFGGPSIRLSRRAKKSSSDNGSDQMVAYVSLPTRKASNDPNRVFGYSEWLVQTKGLIRMVRTPSVVWSISISRQPVARSRT